MITVKASLKRGAFFDELFFHRSRRIAKLSGIQANAREKQSLHFTAAALVRSAAGKIFLIKRRMRNENT